MSFSHQLFSADVFSEGVWQSLAELQDPELKRLVGLLPATVLQSRADSTSRKYINAFRRWKLWAEAKDEIKIYPVEEVAFLQHLGESSKSKAAVEEAVNALSWINLISGLAPISESSFVRATMEG